MTLIKPLRFGFSPDLRSTTPLYAQLAERLAETLRSGRYQAHEALPSERQLSEGLNLSRVTARKAIDRLVAQGLVVRKRGSGNFVAPRLEQPLSRLTSFSEELRQRGFEPGSRWLSRRCTAAAPEEQLSLGLSPGARVARLERLRLADGTVMAYEISALPEPVLPDPAEVLNSLYEHLGAIGKAPARALQHIRAMNADPRRAQLLGVATGHALLFITRVGYLDTGVPVELTVSYCRSDFYGFVTEMRRDG
jgi:GntR family transcriptional regulator